MFITKRHPVAPLNKFIRLPVHTGGVFGPGLQMQVISPARTTRLWGQEVVFPTIPISSVYRAWKGAVINARAYQVTPETQWVIETM